MSTGQALDGGPSQLTLDLSQLSHRPSRVGVTPGPTLCALAADVAGANRGSPREWVAATRAQLEPRDLVVLRPVGEPSGRFTPGRVLISGIEETGSVDDELERIATLPVDHLLEDIDFDFGGSPPELWQIVARRPRQWLVRYAEALGKVWQVMQEPWAAAAQLIDREIERVAIAVDNGTMPELLAPLHHRAHVRDGVWQLPDNKRLELHVADDGLVITPTLGGPESARAMFTDAGVLRAITYPLPSVERVQRGELLPPAEALESLLGVQRTHILRLLDRPRTAGQIAKSLATSPASATYHLRELESAGLVLRERAGQHVIVHRTARGSTLLGIY